MTKYEIILYGSNEDLAFMAEGSELAGCAVDGAHRQEALANAEANRRMARNRPRTWTPHPRTQRPSAVRVN